MTTMTATAPAAGATTKTGRQSLTGSLKLLKFMLRRDRVRIPIWTLALAGGSAAVNSSWESLYPSGPELQNLAQTLESPAMVAMVGVNHAPPGETTYGALMGQEMLWFTLIAVAIMSILLMVRHTRAEEESGRAELVESDVVGRFAQLTAAFGLVFIANLAVALGTALFLGAQGVDSVDWAGSWLYGAAHLVIGMVFAAIAAITAQISEYSRGAAGIAFAALGAAYMIRAAGDVGENGLSWLSPIGWAQATEVYVNNLWWPLLIGVAAFVLLAGGAYQLSTRRDIGAGLRASRPGRAAASKSLRSPIGLATRLQRGLLIGFAAAMALFGMSYGSILGDAETMLEEITAFGEMVESIQGPPAMAFASMLVTVMAMISSIYVVLAMQKPRSEETSERAEPVLATAVSQYRWLGSHIAVAAVGGVIMLLMVGLFFGATGASTTSDNSLFVDLLGAALAYTPAVLLTLSVAVALYGWLPRWQPLAWVVVVYSIVVVYMGPLLQIPQWMENLSPFGHVPQLPVAEFDVVPLLILTLLAAAVTAFGMVGFRRRDLKT